MGRSPEIRGTIKMRNGISAVLIVKDGEQVLDRCLKSIVEVDEIVVLVNQTTDRSVEIAKAYTDKVHTAPDEAVMIRTPAGESKFHFAQARNLALSYAREDWVVTIDADEVAHEGFVKKIRKIIKRYPDATGFNVRFIVSSEGGENPASIQRMKVFRRGMWEWKQRIHEVLSPVVNPFSRSPLKVLDIDTAVMEHLPIENKEERRAQNLDLLKVSVQEAPEYIRNARQLGMELFDREQYREALQWLELYLASGTGGALDRSETMIHLARCHAGIGVLFDAVKYFDLAIAEAPMRREAHYYKALALIKEAQVDQAIEVLEQCLAIPESAKPDFHLNIENIWSGQYPNEALAFCRGQVDEAKKKLAERKGIV
jgi:glycosyltransferase involved in cell wall biosynthesis